MTHLWLHWMPQFCLPFATEEMHQKNLSTGRKRSIRHTGHYVWWRGADLDTPVLVARKFHGLTDKVCANKGKAQISREIYAMSFSVLVGWSIEGFTLPWNQWLTYFKWSIYIYIYMNNDKQLHTRFDKRQTRIHGMPNRPFIFPERVLLVQLLEHAWAMMPLISWDSCSEQFVSHS